MILDKIICQLKHNQFISQKECKLIQSKECKHCIHNDEYVPVQLKADLIILIEKYGIGYIKKAINQIEKGGSI